MQPMYGTVAAIAVVAIYYVWRNYLRFLLSRERTLRQRVAFMLWVVANPDAEVALEGDPLGNHELHLTS